LFADQHSGKPKISMAPLLIVAAASGGGILLSYGLCGASNAIHTYRYPSDLFVAGVIVLALSVLSMLGSVVWLVVVLLFNSFRS
jgi:hypothetical protein